MSFWRRNLILCQICCQRKPKSPQNWSQKMWSKNWRSQQYSHRTDPLWKQCHRRPTRKTQLKDQFLLMPSLQTIRMLWSHPLTKLLLSLRPTKVLFLRNRLKNWDSISVIMFWINSFFKIKFKFQTNLIQLLRDRIIHCLQFGMSLP